MRQRSPVKRRPLPFDPVTGEAPAAPMLDHAQTPPRAHPKQPSQQGYIPNQSPLQAVEYNTPPPGARPLVDHYSPSSQAGTQPGYPASSAPRPVQHSRDPYETPPRHYDDRDYGANAPIPTYEQLADPRGQYSDLPEAYDMPPRADPRQLPSFDDEAPPPPPAHRSRHNSGGQELTQRHSFDMSAQKPTPPMPMRHDVLRSEAHRQSMPAYPGRPTFRAYDSAPPAPNPNQQNSIMTYEAPAPRHHSHDSTYDPHYRSMQPTVEDVPDSPSGHGAYSHGRSFSRQPQEEPEYEKVPSPAPLNLSRSPGGSAHYRTPSPINSQGDYQEPNGYPMTVSPLPTREYSDSPGQMVYHPRNSQNQHYGQRSEVETPQFQSSSSYGLPALPSSLVPGLDPTLSRDISERIYEERRQEDRYSAPIAATPPRGRHRSEPPASYAPGPATSPGYGGQMYDRQTAVAYSGGPDSSMVRQSNIATSPGSGPHHAIRRKSVSPAPPPSESRRLSDIPFGPDSYDALNPSLVSSHAGSSRVGGGGGGGSGGGSGSNYIDPDAKIIMHDGREVDPSDHLPMDSWAPEPEPKPNQKPASDTRSRPLPSGAQPMPPSGRRPLRVAQRQTLPAPPPAPMYAQPEERHAPPTPVSGGRNRLQKKAHRVSAVPSPSASSPLAPISPDNYQDRQSPYTTPTRGSRRSGGFEYSSENHAPGYGVPPIPAKIPLPIMSGANGASADQMALMEEMQRIDIGAGRSRRRGGY